MDSFLKSTDVVDWQKPAVRTKALELANGTSGELQIARRCFEWVRDNIQHSSDFQRNPVTCAAPEVLAHRTGYCYAKSHLLAALLRANGIPAGFCYQRLSIDDKGAPYSLHGFNAIYLTEFGWYRVDSRGNKPGVDAQFCPPEERLAFRLNFPEEKDFPEILSEPLPIVVRALRAHSTWDAMYHNLPDWDYPSLAQAER
jgi:transglutaminase-like putative cysteine protease